MTTASFRGLVFCLSCVFVTVAAAADAPVFKAGFAERDITPEVGMEAPGGYGKAYHQSVHDACKVRAAVFGDGPARVAVVGMDALFIRRPTVQAVRQEIQKQCGIAPEAVLIGASHSHAAGPMGFFLPGEFDPASPLVKSLVYDKTVTAHPGYLARVNKLCTYVQNGAICGFGNVQPEGSSYKQAAFRQDAFMMWEPDDRGTGYGYNDGSSFPDPLVDGGLGSRHGKIGGIVLNVSGSVLFVKSNAWYIEAKDTSKNRLWCNPGSSNGH